jgi:KaiC/GvpD/RAD55 family RecA-like ATPase
VAAPRQTPVDRYSSSGRNAGGRYPSSLLVAGPAGSGKSARAAQFIAAGLAAGEPAVIAMFEEHPKEFLAHAKSMAPNLETMAHKGCWR